jgi:TRAP-type uncharacterized transport system fused permease subunit
LSSASSIFPGFTITLVLAVGANFGVVAMLVITGAVAILLGMGLPTSAVYVLFGRIGGAREDGTQSARGAYSSSISG